MNTFRVAVLLTALTAIFVLVGHLLGGMGGMLVAFGIAVIINFGTYWFSDRIVLKMVKARDPGTGEAPILHEMVERLSRNAGIPKPRVYVVDDPSPNAFATGRNPANGAVAVNTGLLQLLDQEELEGVVAHELAHIRHRDTLTMTIVATLAGAIMLIAMMIRYAAIFSSDRRVNSVALLAIAIVAPLAATLIQLAISRAREYEADRSGAEIAGTPRGLANALQKLERGTALQPCDVAPAVAPLYIVNPLRAGEVLSSLFTTHPPVRKRVERLMALPTTRS